MLKIGPKLQSSVKRYFLKNTVRAKYNRNMDAATVSGVVALTQMVKIPHWDPQDLCIFTLSIGAYLKSMGLAVKHLMDLQPIRKRAIKIKKACKL